MPTPIPTGFAEVTLEWLIGGQRPAFTVFGVNIMGNTQTPDELAQAIYEAFVDAFMDELSLGVSLTGCIVITGDDLVGEHSAQTVGGKSGSMTTSNTCYLIDKRTGVLGRRNHGSMFLPGVNEDAVDSTGQIEASQRAQLQVACDAFLPALEANDSTMVLLHSQYRNSQGQLVPPDIDDVPAPTFVTSLRVDPIAATQRRRMR